MPKTLPNQVPLFDEDQAPKDRWMIPVAGAVVALCLLVVIGGTMARAVLGGLVDRAVERETADLQSQIDDLSDAAMAAAEAGASDAGIWPAPGEEPPDFGMFDGEGMPDFGMFDGEMDKDAAAWLALLMIMGLGLADMGSGDGDWRDHGHAEDEDFWHREECPLPAP